MVTFPHEGLSCPTGRPIRHLNSNRLSLSKRHELGGSSMSPAMTHDTCTSMTHCPHHRSLTSSLSSSLSSHFSTFDAAIVPAPAPTPAPVLALTFAPLAVSSPKIFDAAMNLEVKSSAHSSAIVIRHPPSLFSHWSSPFIYVSVSHFQRFSLPKSSSFRGTRKKIK